MDSPRGPAFQPQGRWSDPEGWARRARPCTFRGCDEVGECDTPETLAAVAVPPRRHCCSWSGCAVGDHHGMPNILEPEWEAELPGLRGQRVGAAAGAEKLGATLYELDPGGRVSPLHIHHANEEMLIVVSGRPTLRTAEGERELAPGEVVAFPAGRRGAHQVLNRSGDAARVLIASTMIYPEVVEHPDSGKVLAISGRPDETAAMFLAFRKDDAVPVTEGEEGR